MKRTQFIKSVLTAGAFGLLPASASQHFQKYYLLQFFVAGFRYYKGPTYLKEMTEGDMLQLIREPQNIHDKSAIAIYWRNEKIGYVPQAENTVLSRLIDAQVLDLLAEITFLNENVEPWENLNVAIYILKKDANSTASEKYLTELETPHYHSFKHIDGSISIVELDDGQDDEESDKNWYDFFVENSSTDAIYTLIHTSNISPGYPYGIETNHYLLVNKKQLNKSHSIIEIVESAEQYLGQLNDLFDIEGYVLLSTNEVENFIDDITKLVDVTDKLGRHYIELIFN